MRALLLIAVFTLVLLSCGDKMDPLGSAGSTVKQCLNNCALSAPSVNDNKKNKMASENNAVNSPNNGSGDRIQNLWSNHFNMW